ncbi:MAG: hypothetical protein IJS08_15640 [Victivallales bacterium]|nr:hypothetical protein [Victivallales bacterium]
MNTQAQSVIISLTSYPPRIKTVDKVIKSLLSQTIQPWKIVLWLAEEEFPEREKSLPGELVALTRETIFEIDWCKNIRSYKKLIPSLRKYPDNVIVTADDDILYPPDTLERLLQAQQTVPNTILSMWVRIITAKGGVIQPFLNWLSTWKNGQCSAKASTDNYLLGGSPTLYPPHCLDERVFDMKLAQSICPNQDDLWFWAMAVINGTKIEGVSCKGYYLKILQGTQEHALWTDNQVGGNDMAIARLFSAFPEIRNRLSLSHRPLPENARHIGGLFKSSREGNRGFSFRLDIPLFQIKYNEDFSEINYYIFKIPIYHKQLSKKDKG